MASNTYIMGDRTVTYEGIVPCGRVIEGTLISCQFCHLFVMLDGIVDFIIFKIVPPLATLMIVIGGVMFMIAYGVGG